MNGKRSTKAGRPTRKIPSKPVIDWDQFQLGVTYELLQGKHFQNFVACKVCCHSNAKRRGLLAKTWTDTGNGKLFVIFRAKDDSK